ncbi:MAG: hypothetical protein GY810_20180 [Aureispira sp.]|nr:hypothetical protein [Aureispira sp.]
MHKVLILVLLGWSTFFTQIQAQEWYISMEGGLKWDFAQTFSTSESELRLSSAPDFIGGANWGVILNPYLFIETGVYVHQFNNNYTLDVDNVEWFKHQRWLPAQMVNFSLRMRTTVLSIQEKFSLHPFIGISLLIQQHQNGKYQSSIDRLPADPQHVESYFRYEYEAFFRTKQLLLAEAGLMAAYTLQDNFRLTCSINFTLGKATITEAHLKWDRHLVNIRDSGENSIKYKGDQVNLMIGVQWMFGKAHKKLD